MKQPPYSYAEAKDICERFQHLKGQAFNKNGNGLVDLVVVSPFDHFKKNRFIMIYLMLNDAKAALELDYTGLQYDIMLISGSISDKGMEHRDLNSWLAEHEEYAEFEFSSPDPNMQVHP
jgi:hypothetical protein